ncbi:hypothetical protein D3C71_1463440 [compost metagenome]
MTKAERHHTKKHEIIGLLSQYRDENGNVDMTKFREDQSSAYTRIPYYFGSVENALQQLHLVASGNSIGKGSPTNRLTLRNELAYDRLVDLRKNHTLEEIGTMYGGVSRAHVNQLFQSLDISVGAKRREKQSAETNI